MTFVRSLRAYAKRPGPIAARLGSKERCEICSTPLLGNEHPHVLEFATRALLCSCDPCARLFVDARASSHRFRTVPDRVVADTIANVDEARWRTVGIPVGLAFLVRNSTSPGARCIYPSPAGPVESEIDPEAWDRLVEVVGMASEAEPDVEALLFRRRRDGRLDCVVAPVDACFAIVGAVRANWRGFDGGDDARRVIEHHLEKLLARSLPWRKGAST